MTPQPQKSNPARERLRLMVVVAHPHDFTHCAGTCGIHSSLGDAVTVVTLTNGATKHNERLYDELIKPVDERDPEIVNQTREAYAREKLRELRAACGLFAATDVRVHGFREPNRMDRTPESVEALKQIILEVRPQVMISHRRYLRGRSGMVSASRNEHDEAGFATHEAMYLASLPDPSNQIAPHTVAVTTTWGPSSKPTRSTSTSTSAIGPRNGFRPRRCSPPKVTPRPSPANESRWMPAGPVGSAGRSTPRDSSAVSQTCSMIFPFHPEPCRKPEDGAWTRSDRFRVNCPGLPNPDMMPGGGL